MAKRSRRGPVWRSPSPQTLSVNRVNKSESKNYNAELKYDNGRPVIKEIKRVSTPGRRVYSKIRELPRHFNGLGISILSTPRGVMSDAEARAANVGGEVICKVF